MILMYHHVAPKSAIPLDPEPDHGWEWLHTPQALERHIKILSRLGYRIESLDAVTSQIEQTGREPARTAVLTFDDGWIDNHRYALPVLRRLGVTATFFATSIHLTEQGADPWKMGSTELRELVRDGMTIGAHTRRHVNLTQATDTELLEEVAGSKKDLESVTQAPVEFFAYPGGAFDAATVEAVRMAGYSAACTSLGPAANDASSLFWLYRDVLSEALATPRDWLRLSRVARRLLAYRTRRRFRSQLDSGAPAA